MKGMFVTIINIGFMWKSKHLLNAILTKIKLTITLNDYVTNIFIIKCIVLMYYKNKTKLAIEF